MITVFWCTTLYTVLIVLWKLLMEPVDALARWWPCARLKRISVLRRLEKSLKFLRCIHVFDLVLKYGSDINEGKWSQLLFYSIVLMGIVASVIGLSLFQLCFGFWTEVVSYCTLTETFAIGFKKWFDHEWIDFGFFVGKKLLSLTSYLYELKSERFAQLLFFFDDTNFFWCLGWGVFWSVL